MNRRSWVGTTLAVALTIYGCENDPTEPSKSLDQAATAATASASDSWLTRAAMPIGDRGYYVTAMVPNKAGESVVYVIGGASQYGPFPPLGRVQVYNVATNKWAPRKDMPTALSRQNGSGVIDGKIYVSGGLPGSWWNSRPAKYLYVFDPATSTWTRKQDMPVGGSEGASGVIKGKLYVLTSCYQDDTGKCVADQNSGGRPRVVSFFRYNPKTDRWTRLPAPAHPSRAGAVLYDKFYVVSPGSLEVYDPATNQWTAKAPPPPDIEVSAVSLWGKLYAMGDQHNPINGTIAHHVNLVYDPGTDTWSERTPTPGTFGNDRPVASKVLLDGRPRIQLLRAWTNLQYIP